MSVTVNVTLRTAGVTVKVMLRAAGVTGECDCKGDIADCRCDRV